jgi:hypothetical protein
MARELGVGFGWWWWWWCRAGMFHVAVGIQVPET